MLPTASLLTASLCFSSALGLDILFPAYIWPENDSGACTPWTPIAQQITAHPDVEFRIIINPDNGPVSTSSDNYPAFSHCIPTLTAAGSNVQLLGYVRTGYAVDPSVSSANVEGNVTLYTTWPSAIRPTGIFFDEVAQTASLASTYATYASFARSKGFNYIVYNPGTRIDPSYFSSADLISTFENPYANFNGASSLTISSSSPAAKQAVLLYAGPSTSPTSTINQVAALGVGAIFVTNDGAGGTNPWDSIPTAWAQEVADVAAA